MIRVKRGFTVIELLVVVVIVAVLTTIALPSYRSARMRSLVVAAESNIRLTVQGLELYAMDHNRFPIPVPDFVDDPLALLSDRQLRVLTTPVAYIPSSALRDPFGVVQAQFIGLGYNNPNDFPRLQQPNAQRSLLYFEYRNLSDRTHLPEIILNGASVISIGPDQKDTFGAYRPFDPFFFVRHLQGFGLDHPYDTVYTPTNGIRSSGDIGGYAGEARRFRVP